MAKLFLSHTSADKPFVRMLATDLIAKGHYCWLDEWEIKVGQSITQMVEKGLDNSEFVLLVVSEKAIESKWVDREWRSKFWKQINAGKVFVLPCLIQHCNVPSLLGDIKYANFIESYGRGLGELLESLTPQINPNKQSLAIEPSPFGEDITTLLDNLYSRTVPLSGCVTQALKLARRMKDADLERFCREELTGESKDEKAQHWRVINCFATTKGELNSSYIGSQPNHRFSSL